MCARILAWNEDLDEVVVQLEEMEDPVRVPVRQIQDLKEVVDKETWGALLDARFRCRFGAVVAIQ